MPGCLLFNNLDCVDVKDLDEVLRVLETQGIARVANRLYPVANIKGTD